jgi:diaminopimelate epimerase
MRPLAFDKYEGLGNDFLLVEASSEAEIDAARARALCDRRFGVGGDGVLVLLPSTTADARMRVVNADGSIPEMCGNGLRCLALHVARLRGEPRVELVIETDAGLRHCIVEGGTVDGGTGEGGTLQGDPAIAGAAVTAQDAMMTVDMGLVRVLEDAAIDVDGERFDLTLADAGNPHAVVIGTGRGIARADFERVGPKLATHARFAQGANIEFAIVKNGAIDLIVWERGVGPTLACGTGACATVAVACAKGLVPFGVPVRVNLPGGALDIRIDAASRHAILRGPARHVFSGVVSEREQAKT